MGSSFMLILVVFNAGVEVDGAGGKKVVDYDYAKYRGYVSTLLTIGNGVTNASVWMMENDFGWISTDTRWVIATFFTPMLLLLPAVISMFKGKPNGQYNTTNAEFVRLFIATRLGIYFCMYYLIHYQVETIITNEVLKFAGT